MINNIILDNEQIPFPEKQSYSYEVIENVYHTEAGTDQVSITRTEKLTASFAFNLSSDWEQKLRVIAKRQSITAVLDEAGEIKTRTVRIRNYKSEMVENSRYTPGTAGLWSVTFDMIEY